MNTRFAVLTSVSMVLLLGCSTPPPQAAPPPTPPSALVVRLVPQPEPAEPRVQACYVNVGHCLDLDPRPFTTCLLGSERCPSDGQITPLGSVHLPHVIVKGVAGR